MDFVLAERHGHTQDLSFSLRSDAHRHQNGQMPHLPIFPNLLVISIQEQVWIFAQGPLSPFRK